MELKLNSCLVCGGGDNADREGENESEACSENESPPRHLDLIILEDT